MKRLKSVWYVYMVRCRDNSLYTGITTDIKRRLEQHRGERKGGAKYLRGKAPLVLVYRKRIGTKSCALRREYMIKKMSRQQKSKLIKGRACRGR